MNNILVEAKNEKDLLLSQMNTIILSTIDKHGLPNASYAPSIVDDDKSTFFVYISKLSKHTRNLLHNNKVSLMIIEDESKSEKIFGRKRFTCTAKATVIKRETPEWENRIKQFENKFGDTINHIKDMTDFTLFKLKAEDGLLVYGFARAFNFSGENLKNINFLNEVGHQTKK